MLLFNKGGVTSRIFPLVLFQKSIFVMLILNVNMYEKILFKKLLAIIQPILQAIVKNYIGF